MINKLNELKANSKTQFVKELCESTINTLTSAIYNGVTNEAKREIERMSLENIFNKLSDVKNDNYVTEWVNNQKRVYSVKNIGVRSAINSIRESEGKYDVALRSLMENFDEKLQNTPEVLLYEEFVSSVQNYSWINSVSESIKKIQETVSKYKSDIGISTVIELMKTTRSNYLVPLIEDVVNNYMANKNEQTKSILKETLVKFSYDPFVRDILNLVTDEAVSLQLEYSSGNAVIESVYSPLKYLGDNEVLFNVKGSFYIKKGNNINKVKNSAVKNIDENFRTLCDAINQPWVDISKNDIKVYMGKDSAVITESGIVINSKKMSDDEFNYSKESAKLIGNEQFFSTVTSLKENFNEIAEVEFVKRVALKDDSSYAADVFKLRENVCVTTYDPVNNKTTFYRNINPIQAEKVMMEHMRFDVSSAFKDLLPNKERILNQISETKKSYVTYINELNDKAKSLLGMPRTENVRMALDAINEEIEIMKSEYKDYINRTENYTSISEGVTVTVDVDGTKYTVPIPQPTSPARGESSDTVAGTEIKSDNNVEPSSQITFDSDKSELLGDNPTIDSDKVDLGVDDIEAAADAAEANADNAGEGEDDEEDQDSLELDGLDDLDDDSDKQEDSAEPDSDKEDDEEDEEKVKEGDESSEPLNDELSKTPLKKSSVVEAGSVKPKQKKKLFIKKKSVTESVRINLKKKINECINVGDPVTLNGEKGYVTGQISDDKVIVMIQGSTKEAKLSDLKSLSDRKNTIEPPFKFDKNTLKALKEQMVKCGVYMNSVPIKTSGCYVNYEQWESSNDDQYLNVIIEGRTNMMQKSNIRILESIDSFANPDNYVPGVIIDEISGEVKENVMINAIDYTQSIGDSSPVRILRNNGGSHEPDVVSAALVKTLSV